MTSSDWITIVFSLIAVLIGAGVSWAFFRTQLLTDVGKLREALDQIREAQIQLKEKMDISGQLDSHDDLLAIRSTVEKLDGDLNRAVSSILSDVKEQQKLLATKIQEKFEAQSIEARQSVQDAFQAELKKFIPDPQQQEQLLNSLVRSFMAGIKTMGEYQKINIEEQSISTASTLEQQIKGSIDNVLKEVTDLKETVEQMPILLGPTE